MNAETFESCCTCASPRHDLAFAFNDDGWVAAKSIIQQALDIGGGSRLSLERGDAVFDALVVDTGDRSGVVPLGRAHHRSGCGAHHPTLARDVKTAGTASLLVSLPTVLAGIGRYARRGAYADRTPLMTTVAPMAIGSVIGAIVGGLLVGLVPAPALKVGLGLILIWSAQRIFRGGHQSPAVRREVQVAAVDGRARRS